jgi:CRP-like cAMP-binding protein
MRDTVEIIDRLQKFELLSHLSPEQLQELASCTTCLTYESGDMPLKEGSKGREVFFIESGKIQIQRNTPYGHYVLADLNPGDIFGETSFIDESGRSGDAQIMQDASLLCINAEKISCLFAQSPKLQIAIYWTFWRSLSVKLRQTNETLAHFFSKSGSPPVRDIEKRIETGEFQVGMSAKKDLFREQKLSTMEINFLSSLSKVKRLEGDEIVFHEGEPGDSLYVVLEGKVLISKIISGAGEEALAILDRGDYFGEMALIDDQPRSADAKAHDQGAVVLAISKDVMDGILNMHRVSSFRLLNILCNMLSKRLREIDDKLVGWYIFSASTGQSLEAPT